MTESSSKRTNVAAFLAILLVSAATMVVLFWHFPVATAVVALAVFALLGVSARLARAIESADVADMERGEPIL
jgi:membrane protein implicated in regulation of membrane protease activity